MATKTESRPPLRLARLRERKGLTQFQVSQMLGITENAYQNWERGRAGVETIKRVVLLCKILGCRAEDLVNPDTTEI